MIRPRSDGKPTLTISSRSARPNDWLSTYWFQSTQLDSRTEVPFTVSSML